MSWNVTTLLSDVVVPSPKLTAIDLGPAVPVVVKLSAPERLVRVPTAISVMSDLVVVASVKRVVFTFEGIAVTPAMGPLLTAKPALPPDAATKLVTFPGAENVTTLAAAAPVLNAPTVPLIVPLPPVKAVPAAITVPAVKLAKEAARLASVTTPVATTVRPFKVKVLVLAIAAKVTIVLVGTPATAVSEVAVNARIAVPEVNVPPVNGAAGVTEPLGEDASDVPTAFVAVTVNVYAVPFDKPVTVNGLEPPDAVNPPGLDVTVKLVIAEPPLLAGALNDTVACELPALALTPVGASGAVAPAPPIIMFLIDIKLILHH
jgi:hypothetical protein